MSLVVAMRPDHPARTRRLLLALRREAVAVVGPGLLSEGAVRSIVRANLGEVASDDLCEAIWAASGGNPLYATELARTVKRDGAPQSGGDPAALLAGGVEQIGRRVIERVDGLDPAALRLAQALAVLGDGCELRDAAAIAEVETSVAARLAAGLVRIDVLADDEPPRFVHPVRSRRSRGLAGPWGTRRRPPYRGAPVARHGGAGRAGRRPPGWSGPRRGSLDVGPAAPGRHGGRRGWRSARRRQPLEPGARRAAPTRRARRGPAPGGPGRGERRQSASVGALAGGAQADGRSTPTSRYLPRSGRGPRSPVQVDRSRRDHRTGPRGAGRRR